MILPLLTSTTQMMPEIPATILTQESGCCQYAQICAARKAASQKSSKGFQPLHKSLNKAFR